TVLDLYGAGHALTMPLVARCGLGTPRLCHEEEQGWLLRAPRFQCLAHRTGAWHEGHQAQPLFPTQTSRPTTIRLAIRHDPVDVLQAPSEARLNRPRRLHTVTRLPIPHPESQRHPAIATHTQTQEHLFEIVPPVFAMPIGRPGRSRRLR